MWVVGGNVTGAHSKDKACVGSGGKCHWVLFEGQDLCEGNVKGQEI